MLVRATLILLTSVCLATVVVDTANRDVVFTAKLWYEKIEDIVFSWAKFEEFFGCFCGTKHQSCIAEYDSQNGNEVTSVGTAGMNMTNIDDDPRYYHCIVQHWDDKLVCQFQNNAPSCTIDDLKFQAFRVENSSCDSLCIGLTWRYTYVNVEFNNTDQNYEFFNDSCECPAVTASTTAAVAPLSTTTTTTTTTTTATTTTTTEISMSTETFSTSTSTATKSGKESEEDTPLGVIIGVVIAVIIIIVVIIVLVALFVRGRTQKQRGSKQREEAMTSLSDLNNGRSAGRPQNGVGDRNCVSPYAIHTLPSNNYYSQTEGSQCCATNNATPRYANVRNGNFAGKAKGDKPSAISQDSCKTIQTDFTENKTKINKSPHSEEHGTKRNNYYVNNNPNLTTTETGKASNVTAPKRRPTIKPISESAATGYELAQFVNEDGNDVGENIAVWDVTKQNNIEANADSGYSAIGNTQNVNEKDRPMKQNMSQIPPYEYAVGIVYAEPEYTYDAVTNNKPVQLNNSNSNTAITTNNKKDNDTEHSINSTYSLAGDINSSSTQNEADNSTHIYSRLHEENRRPQNPYNTLLQPNERDTTHKPFSGSTHISQTANQPSCYSFAQPISNEKEDNNIGVKDDAMSQNHTYYVLEPSELQVSGGEEHNCDVTDKKQNIYFELEKQEDISDSDVEA